MKRTKIELYFTDCDLGHEECFIFDASERGFVTYSAHRNYIFRAKTQDIQVSVPRGYGYDRETAISMLSWIRTARITSHDISKC